MSTIVRQIFKKGPDGRLINTSDEIERHPAWSELVLDLVIVANFYQLGKGFSDNAEKYGVVSVIIYFVQFAPLFYRWMDVTSFLNKFDTGNAFSVWNLFVFTVMNRTIPLLAEHQLGPYAFCMVLVMTGNIVINIYVAIMVPCARFDRTTSSLISFVQALLWGIVWLSPYHVGILAWVCSLVMTLLYNKVIVFAELILSKYMDETRDVKIPIDVELMTERLGLLIVLAIGEVLMTTVKSNFEQGDMSHWWTANLPAELTSWRPLFSTLIAVGLALHSKMAYFDVYGCPGEEVSGVKIHAFKRTLLSGSLYIIFHLLAIMFIVLSAGMLELSNELASEGDELVIPGFARLISGVAFAGINASFGALRAQHVYEDEVIANQIVSRTTRHVVMAVVCVFQIAGAVVFPFGDPLLLQFYGQALFAANIFFEECCQDRWIRKKSKLPMQSEHRIVHTPPPPGVHEERTTFDSAGGMIHFVQYHSTGEDTIATTDKNGSGVSSAAGSTTRSFDNARHGGPKETDRLLR